MKRILAILTALILCPVWCLAEIDLTGMTYDELVALKDQINLAIWASEEWQEVEVPQGIWVVGEDIPVGRWTIRAADGITVYIKWGDTLDASGADISYSHNLYIDEFLYSTTYKNYEKGDSTEVTWELKEGQYILVDDGIVTFTPYSGKPSLGFK